jgi:hypothetical protein
MPALRFDSLLEVSLNLVNLISVIFGNQAGVVRDCLWVAAVGCFCGFAEDIKSSLFCLLRKIDDFFYCLVDSR